MEVEEAFPKQNCQEPNQFALTLANLAAFIAY